MMASSSLANVRLFNSTTSSTTTAAIFHSSRPRNVRLAKHITRSSLVQELDMRYYPTAPAHCLLDLSSGDVAVIVDEPGATSALAAEQQMYAILEAVSDRVEMHSNIGDQRDNWNTLLLNSINMMTLTATALAALGVAESPMPLKVSSTLLFTAATGMLLIMNKIQPSQLAEEQRNAVRLFKQLESEIRTTLAVRSSTKSDVKEAMERVIALDRAYPLPLLGGAMIEKFPKKFEPATWWPTAKPRKGDNKKTMKRYPSSGVQAYDNKNGWSEELEVEMRAIVNVLKTKDEKDYLRLGGIALKANKAMAVAGPALTALAAAASAFGGGLSIVAAVAGPLGAVVSALEHGGQVGMVVEMYRNCAGVFRRMEEEIEAEIDDKRVNGELFEMKVALRLGRSLSQLRDLARKSIVSRIEGSEIEEFGSKLF